MSIEISGVSKIFGSFKALDDVSITVRQGELLALLGPSGSGKTTLLRIIAGLEAADGGSVMFSGKDASNTSIKDRRVGFVFQHYALFRHMNVFNNVAFGLQVRPKPQRPSKQEIRERVMELLRLVQLEELAGRFPAQLSGGQRQRVALARALAVEPQVLLLDEPFGALDARVRLELRTWLRKLHDDLHITSVFVTHDQDEALELADRVAIMSHGKIEQVGTPEEVYQNPANPFVFNFLGQVNVFHGRVNEGIASVGGVKLNVPHHAHVSDSPAIVFARPHELDINRIRSGDSSFSALVKGIHAVGPVVRLDLVRQDDGQSIEAQISHEWNKELALSAGDSFFVTPRKLQVFLEDYAI